MERFPGYITAHLHALCSNALCSDTGRQGKTSTATRRTTAVQKELNRRNTGHEGTTKEHRHPSWGHNWGHGSSYYKHGPSSWSPPSRFTFFIIIFFSPSSSISHATFYICHCSPVTRLSSHQALHFHGGLPEGDRGAASRFWTPVDLSHGPFLQACHPQLQHGVWGSSAAPTGGGGASACHQRDGAAVGRAQGGVCALRAGSGGPWGAGVTDIQCSTAGGAVRGGEQSTAKERPAVQETSTHHCLLLHARASHVPPLACEAQIGRNGGLHFHYRFRSVLYINGKIDFHSLAITH